MAKYTLSEVATRQKVLLEKLQDLPATNEAQAILDLLDIQVRMAHILADIINKKRRGRMMCPYLDIKCTEQSPNRCATCCVYLSMKYKGTLTKKEEGSQ